MSLWILGTAVVLTPKSSAGGTGVGAAGVSTYSKSSEDSEIDLDISPGLNGYPKASKEAQENSDTTIFNFGTCQGR